MTPAPQGAQPDGSHLVSNGVDAGADRALASTEPGAWPHDVSHTPTMTIGAAIETLKEEFPAVTVSKLRFFEREGLVSPSRTTAGYRTYSRADIERLRYALIAQRDAYLPLRVIRDQLDDLDAGRAAEPPPELARLVAREGNLVEPSRSRLNATELSEATGVSLTEIDEMTTAGLIRADRRGRYEGRAVRIAVLAASLARQGIDARHLRAVRLATEREADTIGRATAHLRQGRQGADRERARAREVELAELVGQLHNELLREAIAQDD